MSDEPLPPIGSPAWLNMDHRDIVREGPRELPSSTGSPRPEVPLIELSDGSGCFTATIMSDEEAKALPLKERPLNHRISSEVYHAVFEAVGAASMCWSPRPSTEVFNTSEAEQIAVNLCFKVANESEKWRTMSATEVCAGNPAIAEYVASLESRLASGNA